MTVHNTARWEGGESRTEALNPQLDTQRRRDDRYGDREGTLASSAEVIRIHEPSTCNVAAITNVCLV